MFNDILKKLMAIVLAVPLLVTQVGISSVWAVDDDPIDPNGAPEIVLVNGPVFEVDPGKSNKIDIKIKNGSAHPASAIVIQPTFTDVNDTPFTVAFDKNENRITSLPPRSEKTVSLHVDMESTATTKSYPITLNYTYFNDFSRKFTGTNTIYVKVKNTKSSPEFELQNVKIVPQTLKAGESGQISGTIYNSTMIPMYAVEVLLDQLEPEGISVTNGLNSKKYDRIMPSSGAGFSFPIMAGKDMKSGNYPLVIKVIYKDENGKAYERAQNFYVDLGGGSNKKAVLEIRNMKEPTGVFGVNQNFNVEFDLVNAGQDETKNIKISAIGMGEGGVVPKSSSVKSIPVLKPGETMHMLYTFAATSASKSQNHAMEFTVEYDDGGETPVTFKQYAGVNITNPEADKKDEEDDKKVSKPKIIVSDYKSEPVIVMAGEEFDLNMEFTNTHKDKPVRNIKMFLTLSEETSSDSEKTGNIFTPVDSSNTFYFDAIPAKGSVSKKMRLFVVPDAQPKTYTLTVNFEYEDLEGHEFTATELLGINVKQKTELDLDEFTLPPDVEMGMPVQVAFSYYNTGKVTLKNLMIRIEGEVESSTKSTYIGNLESGSSDYFEGEFTAMIVGSLPVSVIISYDDPSGETIETRRDFDLNVIEPMPMDEGMGMEDMNQKPPFWKNVKLMAILGGILMVVVALIVFLVIKKRKHRKAEEAFLAAEDDEIEETTENEDLPL